MTPDYITARYPDASTVAPYERYNQDTAERRLVAAGEIAAWVKKTLAEEGHAV